MRRRTCALVRMSDVIFSHQVSLPSMIYDHDCDTQLPTNILDQDFDAHVKELPPARPHTEATSTAYMIAKSRLCNELGNILQATTRVGRGVPYDEIIRFDAKLRQVMQELPPHLKLSALQGPSDAPSLIMARFQLDILYQKMLCLLHRKYISKARQNARYAHSRRSAIEASLHAMGHLQTLHREAQGDGRLRAVASLINSMATKEFILPAMLIVLDLHYDNLAPESAVGAQDHEGACLWSLQERSTMIGALQKTAAIWRSLADGSVEAFKACKTVEIMLDKIKDPVQHASQPPFADLNLASTVAMDQSSSSSLMAPQGFGGDMNMGLHPFAAVSSNSSPVGIDFGMPPPGLGDMQPDSYNVVGAASPLSMFTNLGTTGGMTADLTGGFDWDAFENYTQMANWGADQSFQIYGDMSLDHGPAMMNA
ncbi:hypothetical protein CDD82_5664 [Ophiocordyceps australis]|uniref:Transcription factor domain-containing protein n=1 Tax=Ophiocordyceps australis TaxID=1399860 RepID=A0A2C5YZN6_9HYPO|nr:hypothetical protein CDD82_5664 [Ophiocordyceps australis]